MYIIYKWAICVIHSIRSTILIGSNRYYIYHSVQSEPSPRLEGRRQRCVRQCRRDRRSQGPCPRPEEAHSAPSVRGLRGQSNLSAVLRLAILYYRLIHCCAIRTMFLMCCLLIVELSSFYVNLYLGYYRTIICAGNSSFHFQPPAQLMFKGADGRVESSALAVAPAAEPASALQYQQQQQPQVSGMFLFLFINSVIFFYQILHIY